MLGLLSLTWATALSLQSFTIAANPALIFPRNTSAPVDTITSTYKSGAPLLSNDTSLQALHHNYVFDRSKPICETATYINAIDLIAYLRQNPTDGLEDKIYHQGTGRVYDQVIFTIGEPPTAPFVRRDAVTGLFRALQRLGGPPREPFYALVQSTEADNGELKLLLTIEPAGPSPPSQETLPLTQRSNVTGTDDLCNDPLATASSEGSQQDPDTSEPQLTAANNTEIDAILQSPDSAASATNDSSSATNDDWFIWSDPTIRTLKFRCRFLGGPDLTWYEAYMPFVNSISTAHFAYEMGLDTPAQAVDAYISDMRAKLRIGGYPSGLRPNAAFTNRWALRALKRMPRIFFEKQTWRGIQVQVMVSDNPIGVIVLVKDSGPAISIATGQGGADAASQGRVDVT
ncbi:MAG: hypothetical protein OHK93_007470 [Ramalina farinacea]|uniref:Uncharacterized protein n=1 Tax=Ramalina farinacea TaxID=258253 RepID=A0AA43QKJ2_9LECA|nr:hypothetical protein [Ramalina farinacea]